MRWRFGVFVLDGDARELSRDGTPLHVSPKALRLLEVLVAAAPGALSRAELYRALWGEAFVEEANLAGLVHEVRAALGDDARESAFVKTVHRFGYRFLAGVHREPADPDDAGGRSVAGFCVEVEGRMVPLEEGRNVVGRGSGAVVRLTSTKVSRRHAVFVVNGQVLTLEDLGSKNGTFVRGNRTSGVTPVVDGDLVQVGSVVLTVCARSRETTATDMHPIVKEVQAIIDREREH